MTSMKLEGQTAFNTPRPGPRPVAHSRVKTPKTYPVHADRRRSIVACPMSLGARVTQTRETREPGPQKWRSIRVSDVFWFAWSAAAGDAHRDESERGS